MTLTRSAVVVALILSLLLATWWFILREPSTGLWAVDQSVEGSTSQLAVDYRVGKFQAIGQLACKNNKVLRSEDMKAQDATKVCGLIDRYGAYYASVMNSTPPVCGGRPQVEARFRGEISGREVDRAFRSPPCSPESRDALRISALLLNSRPAALVSPSGSAGSSGEVVKTPRRDKEPPKGFYGPDAGEVKPAKPKGY